MLHLHPDERPAADASRRRLCRGLPAVVLLLFVLIATSGCGGSRRALVQEQRRAIDSLTTLTLQLRTERDTLRDAVTRYRAHLDTLAARRAMEKARGDSAFALRIDSLRRRDVLLFLRAQEKAGRLRGETVEVIYFDSGSVGLSANGRARLQRIVASLRRLPASARILVEGHTDDVPFTGNSRQNNRVLSAERAAAVQRFLVEQSGLDPGRFETAGFGADMPLFPNEDATVRRYNRRVRIAVVEP